MQVAAGVLLARREAHANATGGRTVRVAQFTTCLHAYAPRARALALYSFVKAVADEITHQEGQCGSCGGSSGTNLLQAAVLVCSTDSYSRTADCGGCTACTSARLGLERTTRYSECHVDSVLKGKDGLKTIGCSGWYVWLVDKRDQGDRRANARERRNWLAKQLRRRRLLVGTKVGLVLICLKFR